MTNAWEKAEMTESEYYEWLLEVTEWHNDDAAARLTIETFSAYVTNGGSTSYRDLNPLIAIVIEAFVCNVWPHGCIFKGEINAHQMIESGCVYVGKELKKVILNEKEREFSLICYEALTAAQDSGQLDDLKQ